MNFGGQNRKISKIRDSRFLERSILRRLAFFDYVLLQNWSEHSSGLQTFAVFLPKNAKRDATKTPFSQKISGRIFLKFWWHTSHWCWGRYWKLRVDICHHFWAIEKIRQGGNICPPQRARVHIIGIRKFLCIYQIIKEVDFFQLKRSYNPLNLEY